MQIINRRKQVSFTRFYEKEYEPKTFSYIHFMVGKKKPEPKDITNNGVKHEELLKLVSKFTGITMEKIQGNSRLTDIVMVRHIHFYLACKYCSMTIKEIGKVNNRDHSSVIHGRDRINADLKFDGKYTDKIRDYIGQIVASIN
jgi:chromosomal replication initiation ATPase DnaA